MPRRRTLRARARSLGRRSLAFLFSNVGVVLLVLGYTIAGAFMFQAIEGVGEMERGSHMARERASTAEHMWQNITLALNLFNETELKLRISGELVRYQRKVVEGARRGWEGGRSSRQWSFSSGFLYSLTVITTIGYGNLSPRTSWGKVATIFYALLGMPLFLLYLSNVGELLARWFKCLYALVCLCRGCPGFTRRRVARLRNQNAETSEVESIERPEAWRTHSDSTEDVPYYRRPDRYDYYHRKFYIRSVSAPYPPRQDSRRTNHYYHRHRHPGPSRPFAQNYRDSHDPQFYDPRGNFEVPRIYRDPRDAFRDPRSGYQGPRGAFRNRRTFRDYSYYNPSDRNRRIIQDQRIMYQDQRNAYHDPRNMYPDPRVREGTGNVREMSGMVRWSDEGSSASAFSYISFDAQTITVPISVCVAVMVSYIIFGSMLFGMWEKWDELDGAYFCFISLSSIGFGDFVPGERVYSEKIETSFIVCSLYLMLGMALVAMCFSLMQEQVIHYVAGLKRALKRICRCKR